MVDLELARRVERAEGLSTVAYVETRRSLDPALAADWIEVAGAHAMFDGPESPVTQSFGIGLFEPFGAAGFERMERFFSQRGATPQHEICSLTDRAVWHQLSSRGYTPFEMSVVLVRPTALPAPGAGPSVSVRVIHPEEEPLWTRVAAEGWSSESAELAEAVRGLGPTIVNSPAVHALVAELEGQPIAAAVLNVANGTAVLGGASTIPQARRRGAQAALLRARLELAAQMGIDLAVVVAQPGSGSQRNAERQGFRPVYVRSKWQLTATA